MKIKLADGLPYHATKIHPRTGNRLRAVYQKRDGTFAWPAIGASEDDDGGSENADEDAETEGEEDKGEEDGTSGAKGQKDTRSQREKDLEAELAKVKTHRSAADKSKAALQKELDELKAKDLTELQKAKADLDKATKEGTALNDRYRDLAITNAFLTESSKAKIQWHDPEVAQAAAKLKGIEVDEDGSVATMGELVKKLAKDRPFLVNSAKDTEDQDDKGKNKNGASGSGVGSGSNGGKGKGNGKLSREELLKKFPALRT